MLILSSVDAVAFDTVAVDAVGLKLLHLLNQVLSPLVVILSRRILLY